MWSTLRKLHTYMLFNSFESYDASLSLTLFKAETAPIRHLVKSGSDLVWSVIVRPVHGFFAAPDSCIQPNPVFPESDCTKKRFTRKSNGALCWASLLSFLSNAAITGCHPKSGSLLWGSELVRTGGTPENSARESDASREFSPWCCWASFEGSISGGLEALSYQKSPSKTPSVSTVKLRALKNIQPEHITRITTTKR